MAIPKPKWLVGSCIVISLVLSAPGRSESDTASKAKGWYVNVYFPHWQDSSTLDLADAAKHYRDPYFRHSIGGFVTTSFLSAEFSTLVADEIARGWLGDNLERIESKIVNKTTASLDVRVASRMSDGSREQHCIWYLVENSEGRWLIANVVEQSCEETY